MPIPDPTILTTQALLREVAAAKELSDTKFEAIAARIEHIDTLLETRDTAITVASTHLRELMLSEMAKIKVVTDEVFQRIDVQFIERDKRTEQLALASSTAIAAALQAAKEAVGAQNTSNSIAIAKSESSTLESLRQLRELFLSETKAINEKVDDLKSRQDRTEGLGAGQVNNMNDSRARANQNVSLMSLLVAAVGAGTAIVIALVFHR
ncbi:MAG TPA: hypothetical protein VG815_16960 [Chloroflexota bacterium]|nr:hypothetical protein [Chloroflexota bacterium]